jgi:hypothetical protein
MDTSMSQRNVNRTRAPIKIWQIPGRIERFLSQEFTFGPECRLVRRGDQFYRAGPD